MSTDFTLTPQTTGKPHKYKDKSSSKPLKRKRSTSERALESSPTKKPRPRKSSKHSLQASPNPNSSDRSPFHHAKYSLYVPLSPITQLHPLEGICAEHLSPLILTYYPPFHGVVLSYSNAILSEDPNLAYKSGGRVLARSVDEYAVSFVWVTADFLIFQPRKGDLIEGWINLQNDGYLGLVCWNFFNASIERKRLPKDWVWKGGGLNVRRKSKGKGDAQSEGSDADMVNLGVEDDKFEDEQGYFKDAEGRKVEGRITFLVKNTEALSSIDRDKGVIRIEGTMLDEKEEQELLEQESIRMNGKVGRNGRPAELEFAMSGATGKPPTGNQETAQRPQRSKHKVKN